MVTRHRVPLIISVLAVLLHSNDSFSVGSSARALSLPSAIPCSSFLVTGGSNCQPRLTSALRMASSGVGDADADLGRNQNKRLASTYNIAKIASTLAWIVTSYVALSFHPDPRFKNCTLRHNLLTMSQAYAFPLPVLWASFDTLRWSAENGTLQSATARSLGLAVSVASFWLAASMAIPPKFAFGYDLYTQSHKVVATMVHAFAGLLTMGVVIRSSSPDEIIRGLVDSLWKLGPKKSETSNDSFEKNSSLFATGSVGLLWFTLLPIVSPYPLATIPTILGKRLSRPASAFTLLGAVMAFCLKEGIDAVPSKADKSLPKHKGNPKRMLSRALAIGSGMHLLLIALKLIGVDGGGWIFPGRGLWEVYPAMMSVPFAAGVSMIIHAILCYAACSFW